MLKKCVKNVNFLFFPPCL